MYIGQYAEQHTGEACMDMIKTCICLQKFKRTGKLGKELGAYVGPNRVLLESLQYRTAKQTFEQGAHRFFEETIRSAIPQSTNQLLESTHLRKFSERQYKLEAAADQAMKADDNRVEESRRSFRTSRRSLMASQRSDKASKLDRDAAVHASLLRHKEEVEKEELKVGRWVRGEGRGWAASIRQLAGSSTWMQSGCPCCTCLDAGCSQRGTGAF
jgi:hypothetical protein